MTTERKALFQPKRITQTAKSGIKSLQAFLDKFNNDWVFSLASGLAFNLLVTVIPLIVAIIGLAGLIYGRLNPTIQEELITYIQHAFLPPLLSQQIIEQALNALNKQAGLMGIVAIITSIIAGSGLFVALEGQLDIIYQVRTRGLIRQKVMALSMVLVFVALAPLAIFASSVPTLLNSLVQATPAGRIAASDFFSGVFAALCGLLATWVLVEIIYLVVPNQHISFRSSWLGALLAAAAIQAYLQIFPFYATHFLSGYTGTVGFVIIFVFFFYYFATILLAGAEINAFYVQGKRALPGNLAAVVYDKAAEGSNGPDVSDS